MSATRSVEFFDTQFRRQNAAREFSLNPFEERALSFLSGRMLDLGCGLGNLDLAAAHKGVRVLALDASKVAIDSLTVRGAGLPIVALCDDLRDYCPEGQFDCVVAIGLFMFFPCLVARRQMRRALDAVRPGGIAVLNVLIEGTTYMDMFDGEDGYCLFGPDELPLALEGWEVLDDRIEQFAAPRGTVKRFRTSIARRGSS